MAAPRNPTPEDVRMDAEHRAASGQTYRVVDGMLIGGRYVRPGQVTGCRCFSKPVLNFD